MWRLSGSRSNAVHDDTAVEPPGHPNRGALPDCGLDGRLQQPRRSETSGGPGRKEAPKRKKRVKRKKKKKKKKDSAWGVVVAVGDAHFLALLFDPLSHLAASAASLSASAAAAFCAAASALRAWPWAFLLVFSDPPFFAMSIA